MVSSLDNVKFLHPVGASTFKYGVTIPVEVQTERMNAICKGGKVPVTILFGTGYGTSSIGGHLVDDTSDRKRH